MKSLSGWLISFGLLAVLSCAYVVNLQVSPDFTSVRRIERTAGIYIETPARDYVYDHGACKIPIGNAFQLGMKKVAVQLFARPLMLDSRPQTWNSSVDLLVLPRINDFHIDNVGLAHNPRAHMVLACRITDSSGATLYDSAITSEKSIEELVKEGRYPGLNDWPQRLTEDVLNQSLSLLVKSLSDDTVLARKSGGD